MSARLGNVVERDKVDRTIKHDGKTCLYADTGSEWPGDRPNVRLVCKIDSVIPDMGKTNM